MEKNATQSQLALICHQLASTLSTGHIFFSTHPFNERCCNVTLSKQSCLKPATRMGDKGRKSAGNFVRNLTGLLGLELAPQLPTLNLGSFNHVPEL